MGGCHAVWRVLLVVGQTSAPLLVAPLSQVVQLRRNICHYPILDDTKAIIYEVGAG